jgi:hypothetical protein
MAIKDIEHDDTGKVGYQYNDQSSQSDSQMKCETEVMVDKINELVEAANKEQELFDRFIKEIDPGIKALVCQYLKDVTDRMQALEDSLAIKRRTEIAVAVLPAIVGLRLDASPQGEIHDAFLYADEVIRQAKETRNAVDAEGS